MSQTTHAPMATAINPYALTEVLLERKVNWSRIADPIKLVSRTLETPAEDLFDGDRGSPIFATNGIHRDDTPRSKDGLQGKIERPLDKLPSLKLRPGMSERLIDRLRDLVLLRPEFGETEYPGAVWQDIGDFFEEGTEFADPVQGALGDCWLIAAIASVAWTRTYAIVQRNRTIGSGNQDFVDAIDLAYAANDVRRYEVSEKLPVWQGTSLQLYGRSAETGEIWPGIYEKAFAKLRTGNLTDKPDLRALGGGDPVDACVKLLPGTSASYRWTNGLSADQLWKAVTQNSIGNPGNANPTLFARAGRTINPLTAWTYGAAKDAPDPIAYDADSGIVACHAYSVLGWIAPAGHLLGKQSRYVVLRNPWGMHEGRVDVLSGNWPALDQTWIRSTPLNTGGVFAMKIETFKKYFAGLGVAA